MKDAQKPTLSSESPTENPQENWIRVHGYQQVVEMLRVADSGFREAILRQLATRNQHLARSLRQKLQ